MVRFSVDFEIVNNRDFGNAERGFIEAAKVRRVTISGVVDPGVARMVLPKGVADQLGFPVNKKKARVRYADGRRALRSEVSDVQVRLLGRAGVFTAVVEPKRDTALIGAIVIEDLDLLVDCKKCCLVPRDPDCAVSEIE